MAPHNSIRPEQLHNSIRPKQYESNNLACGKSLSVCSMVPLREFSLSSCFYPFPTLGIVVGSRPWPGHRGPPPPGTIWVPSICVGRAVTGTGRSQSLHRALLNSWIRESICINDYHSTND